MQNETSLSDEHSIPKFALTDDDIDREIDPNDPPWSPVAAILFWVASVVAIAVFPAILLIPYIVSTVADPTDSVRVAEFSQSDPTAIMLQIVGIAPAHLATIIVGWLIVTGGGKRPFFATLGWRSGGIRWWHYLIIMGGFFMVAAIVQQFIPEQEHTLIRMLKSSRNAVIALAILAVLSAPLVEEVVYRGVLFSAFQKRFGVPSAFALVTLLFALVHVPQYLESISTILLLTLLSVILTFLRVYSGNLWPAFLLHTVFNGLQSLLLLAEPYIAPLAEQGVQ